MDSLQAEFVLFAIKRRGGLTESLDDLDRELWTSWFPGKGVRVPLLDAKGNVTSGSQAFIHAQLKRVNIRPSVHMTEWVAKAIPGVESWLRELRQLEPHRGAILLIAQFSCKDEILFTNRVLDMATGTYGPSTRDVVRLCAVPGLHR